MEWMTTAVLYACTEELFTIENEKRSVRSERFRLNVGLNLYELLTIAVMITIMISIVLVIPIVPITVRVPAVAFNIPPTVRMLPAVMPRVA